jgi:hypothetical protein
MYINGKMIPVETISEMREGRIKENCGGVNSSMIYLIHSKNFVNATSTAKKKSPQTYRIEIKPDYFFKNF